MSIRVINRLADRLNWFVERTCALLVGAMVVIIWFGSSNVISWNWG